LLVAFGFALGGIPSGRAANVEVDSQIVGQMYELRTADAGSSDARLVDRRRLTTYLGLHISGLGPKDDDGLPGWRNQFAVHFQMRFDADFGDYLCAIGRSSYGSALGCLGRDKGGKSLSPELSNYKPEILEGYIEGHSLGGWVDMRLGRQIQWDLFDLRGFDGLWGQARTPIYVAAEAFGGLAQNGTLPMRRQCWQRQPHSATLHEPKETTTHESRSAAQAEARRWPAKSRQGQDDGAYFARDSAGSRRQTRRSPRRALRRLERLSYATPRKSKRMNTTPNAQTANAPGVGISELLACPFCGGPARLDVIKWWFCKWEYKAKCVVCETYAPGEWTPDTSIAVIQWNTRHANEKLTDAGTKTL